MNQDHALAITKMVPCSAYFLPEPCPLAGRLVDLDLPLLAVHLVRVVVSDVGRDSVVESQSRSEVVEEILDCGV